MEGGGHPRPEGREERPLRKRRRVVISCTECHRRKQKCDRLVPCTNCVSRMKQNLCSYDSNSAAPSGMPDDKSEEFEVEIDSMQALNSLGFAESAGNNSFNVYQIIQRSNADERNAQSLSKGPNEKSNDTTLKEKYKSYVRQLPSSMYIDLLLTSYFERVNFFYYTFDEDVTRERLHRWRSLPFKMLNNGPDELPPDLRTFPTVLFQILALALQFQTPGYDAILDGLKYSVDMTLDDLARDYSDTGAALLTLLGKRNANILTVQAGLLRGLYLKTAGLSIESWHAIGETIRDAQEIGLHTDTIPGMISTNPVEAMESMWELELRRRMWLILCLWDAHLALTLGRPSFINDVGKCTLPIDVPLNCDRKVTLAVPRPSRSPPSPLSSLIYHAPIINMLGEIKALESEGVCPSDFGKVETIHRKLVNKQDELPPFLRLNNPDTSFDSLPECHWLPVARAQIQSSCAFVLLCLHRPYAFTNQKSRVEALKAALNVLKAQRQMSDAGPRRFCTLVFNTFDAVVFIAAVYILHPHENRRYLGAALQQFVWAKETFETISSMSVLAKNALSVVNAITVRLTKALSKSCTHNMGQPILTPPQPKITVEIEPPTRNSLDFSILDRIISDANNQEETEKDSPVVPDLDFSFEASPPNPLTPATTDTNHMLSARPLTNTSTPNTQSLNFDSLPANFDFNFMPPLQPMVDLLFNDLNGPSSFTQPLGHDQQAIATNVEGTLPWQFEGDFGDDSFWNFMNQYEP